MPHSPEQLRTALAKAALLLSQAGDPENGRIVADHIVELVSQPKEDRYSSTFGAAMLAFEEGRTEWGDSLLFEGRESSDVEPIEDDRISHLPDCTYRGGGE